MEEADAQAYGRNLKKQHRYRAGFFDTHPTDLDRADYLLTESLKFGDTGNAESKRYYQTITPYLPALLDSQIKLNDFNGTDYILSGIAANTGWTGELLQARAEMYSARGQPRDLVTATTLYLNAIDAGYSHPENAARPRAKSGEERANAQRADDTLPSTSMRFLTRPMRELFARTCRRRPIEMFRIAIAAALSLASIAPAHAHKLIEPKLQENIAKGAYSARPSTTWNRLSEKEGKYQEIWTLDGDQLNRVIFFGGVAGW